MVSAGAVALVVLVCGCLGGEEASTAGVGGVTTSTAASTADAGAATRISYQETPDGFPLLFRLGSELWIIFKSKPLSKSNLYLVGSSDNGTTWETGNPRRVTDSGGNSEHTSIIRKEDLLLVAWDDGSEVKYTVSLDGGGHWKQKELHSGQSWYPYAYVVGDEIWYLFISREAGLGGVIEYTTSLDGESWGAVKEVLKNPDQSGETTIYGNPVLYEADGELWLLWDTGAESEPVSDILWMKSQDNGKTWSRPEVITKETGDLDDVDPCICEQDGRPLLVYASRPENEPDTDYKIFYRVYENGVWSQPTKLGEPYNHPENHVLDWYPYCFTDSDGRLLLAWASNRVTAGKSSTRMDVIEDNREIFTAPLKI